MFKKICLVGLAAAVFSFAQEETFIRNICDSLPASATPKVELRLAYVDVTQWYGSIDLSKTDSVSVKRHESYEALAPFRDKFTEKLPVSIPASCAETKNNLYKYAEWSESSKKWTLNDENDDYATQIMDINQMEFPGYNSSNTYNILAIKKGALPEDGAYSMGELMVSKTFELQFDWWYTVVAYKIETETVDGNTKTIHTSWKMANAIAMDSTTSVTAALGALPESDTVSKAQYQQFHVVLKDANKLSSRDASSSSVAKSSSSEAKSSSSEASSSSSKAKSSSSVKPGSSDSSEAIGRLPAKPRAFGAARAVRRLDGSLVKAGEQLVPGVYYVKGVDGRWKKQVELP